LLIPAFKVLGQGHHGSRPLASSSYPVGDGIAGSLVDDAQMVNGSRDTTYLWVRCVVPRQLVYHVAQFTGRTTVLALRVVSVKLVWFPTNTVEKRPGSFALVVPRAT
jgi:hypothetical protein